MEFLSQLSVYSEWAGQALQQLFNAWLYIQFVLPVPIYFTAISAISILIALGLKRIIL